MDLNEFIEHWQKKANKIRNDGTYKKMCHIDPQPWYAEAKTIETILDDLRALAKADTGERQLTIPDVSNRRELLLDFMTYVSPEAYATHSKAELADNYLSSNSC